MESLSPQSGGENVKSTSRVKRAKPHLLRARKVGEIGVQYVALHVRLIECAHQRTVARYKCINGSLVTSKIVAIQAVCREPIAGFEFRHHRYGKICEYIEGHPGRSTQCRAFQECALCAEVKGPQGQVNHHCSPWVFAYMPCRAGKAAEKLLVRCIDSRRARKNDGSGWLADVSREAHDSAVK